MASVVKVAIVLLITSGIFVSIYLLWQRQPKPKTEEPQTKIETIVESENGENTQVSSFVTTPKRGEISTSAKVTLSGKVDPDSRVLIYSISQNDIVKSQLDGIFSLDITLPDGINLIQISTLDTNFQEKESATIPVYVSQQGAQNNLSFVAGTVKKLFQNSISITAISGEIDLETNTSTLFENQQTSKNSKSPSSAKEDLRVGDYIVGLGQPGSNSTFKAQTIKIYRDNKPAIKKSYAPLKFVSVVKNNIFSGTNLTNSKLLEFTLDKNSQIFELNKKVTSKTITKDKTAIIFYQDSDTNLVTAIYFL